MIHKTRKTRSTRKTHKTRITRSTRSKQRGGFSYGDVMAGAKQRTLEMQRIPPEKIPDRPIEESLTEEEEKQTATLIAPDPKHPSRNILHRLLYAISQGQIPKPLTTVENFIDARRSEMTRLVNEKTVGKWFGGGHTPINILEKHCTKPCSYALYYHIKKALESFIIPT